MMTTPLPPRVLIATPIKNAERHLDKYFSLLNTLDYPRDRLSLAMLESDSTDGTWTALQDKLPQLRESFDNVTILKKDYNFDIQGPRWQEDVQYARRSILARSRNRLIQATLGQEDWVLWLDCDLHSYPPKLLTELLLAEKDIVAPHCVRVGTAMNFEMKNFSFSTRTFDMNTFVLRKRSRLDRWRRPRTMSPGKIYLAPQDIGRLYLDSFSAEDLVRVDGVGGCTLLVKADLHREGLMFPPYSYRGYIETEGLAALAADMGYDCWALPNLEVVHAEH
jgi:glycosyltransferase involved in cell wall biosynthesis